MTIFGACASSCNYRRHVRGAVMRATTTCPYSPLLVSTARLAPKCVSVLFRNRAIIFVRSDSACVLSCRRPWYMHVLSGTHVPSIVSKLLRAGDVVWNVALGDEGNVGKMAVILWYVHYRILGTSAKRPGSDTTRTGPRL